jgi:microcystin-dependent protein
LENTARTLLDTAITGVLALSVAGGSNVTLTYNQGAPDQTRNQHFVCSGVTTANVYVFMPNGLTRMFSMQSAITPGALVSSGNVTAGSNIITGIPATGTMAVGQPVSGTGIPPNTFITSIDSGTQIHISQAPTAGTGSSQPLTFTYTLLAAVTNGSNAPAGAYQAIPQGSTMEFVSDGTNVYERNSALLQAFVTVLGGTIDNTTIGGLTPANATVANLTVTGTTTGITTVPAGTIAQTAAVTAPSGWLFCYGQAISRATYATLFAAIAINTTGNVTNGSPIITGIASTTTNMAVGMPISGPGIPSSTTVFSIDSSSQIHISNNANSGSGSAVSIVVAPQGVGDGVTTFNVPDYRGRASFGVDNMGGSAANRVTNSASGIQGVTLGNAGGSQLLHQHVHANTLNDPTHQHGSPDALDAPFAYVGGAGGGVPQPTGSTAWSQYDHTAAAATGMSITNANAGTGASQNMPPAIMMNIMIKT